MKARGSNRAFEHGFRTPHKKFAGPQGEKPGRQFYYLRLMQVAIRHDYYTNHECPDFTIFPTRYSHELMKSLGLVFKDEGTGFSIFFDARRSDILIEYLKRQEWPPGSKHCWTRLSFVLSLKNSYFLNFTDVPIAINPVNQNFYFTNQAARGRTANGDILLNPGEEHELLDVVPVQLGVVVTDHIKEVEVQSVPQTEEGSRDAVICRPRCVPVSLLEKGNAASITCKEAIHCKGPHEKKDPAKSLVLCRCTDKIYLDFSPLPEDKYTVRRIPYPSTSEIAPDEEPVLYTESYPVPFCFVSLFFTSPTGEKPKLFPVQDLFGPEPKIESITYELKFERRATYWNYFVVPPAGESIENLKIEGEPGIFFNGPCSVVLPNQTKAYRFVSKKPLPFMEQSTFRFRLCGELSTTTQNTILVKNLPVASAEQVLQDELAACLSLDGSINPGSKGDCRKLKSQTCRCVCGDMPINKCLKLIKRICADPRSPECRQLRSACSRIYSDTFVYV
ncbi:MAG TPA: hypothetical protein VE135_04875 [Pyrinomonadaceae bacterium]|nr:hypothetical protein [Pyrinomonadaceae bacterium]